jgi:hypothetical protein
MGTRQIGRKSLDLRGLRDSGTGEDGRVASEIAFVEVENIDWEAWEGGRIDFVRVNKDQLDCHHANRQRNCRRAAPAARFWPAVFPSMFIFSMFRQWRIVLYFQVSQTVWPRPVTVTVSCDY